MGGFTLGKEFSLWVGSKEEPVRETLFSMD